MDNFENEFVAKLKPYKVVGHKAWEYKDKASVLKLDWNESTTEPAPEVKEAVKDFVVNGNLHWYPDVSNNELRRCLSNYVGISEDHVDYYSSSDSLHEYIARVYVGINDTVALLGPTYDNFRAVAEAAGADVLHYNMTRDDGYQFSIDGAQAFISQYKPKIFYICNPNNPTGTLIAYELLRNLIVSNPDVLFVVDEAYYEFTGITVSGLCEEVYNLIICRTFSKAFGLASFRVGYVIANFRHISLLSKVKNHKSTTAMSQVAAIAALKNVIYMQDFVREVLECKLWFRERLYELGYEVINSTGGNYLLSDFGSSRVDVVKELEKNRIFIRSLDHIPELEGVHRITIGTKEQMAQVLSILTVLNSI